MYTSHPLYSFICEGHLGCLHILAILNNSAVSIGVYYFSTNVFLFFRCIRRSGIAGSCDSFIFNFLRILHIAFHSGYTSLHPH